MDTDMSDAPYKPFEPDWTVSPGEMLAETLEDRGISPFGLAGGPGSVEDSFGESSAAVRGILIGTVPVTEEIAGELERVLNGPPARFWLNAEALYQKDLIRLGRAVRVCARCRRALADEDAMGWFYRDTICVHSCGGLPHDVIVRDRDLMAELEGARQCPYC